MIEIEKEELMNINGGVNMTGAFINSFARGVQVIFDIGKSLGSTIRRLQNGSLCPI